jgi:triosephosphate isomerase
VIYKICISITRVIYLTITTFFEGGNGLLPEALIITAALERLASFTENEVKNLHIVCQGIFRENIVPGGNFVAFTTNLPAAAAKNLGCTWPIIGHSEELRVKVANTINDIINQEVLCALNSGLDILLCIGETAEERGNGSFKEQKSQIQAVLKSQLGIGLKSIQDELFERKIIIGHEPILAIGSGKIPLDREYISFVSSYIKSYI